MQITNHEGEIELELKIMAEVSARVLAQYKKDELYNNIKYLNDVLFMNNMNRLMAIEAQQRAVQNRILQLNREAAMQKQ